jgi:hypothetical protein
MKRYFHSPDASGESSNGEWIMYEDFKYAIAELICAIDGLQTPKRYQTSVNVINHYKELIK